MNNLIEKVLSIKNVRLEKLLWNGQDTRKRIVTCDNGDLLGVVGRNYQPLGHGDLYAQVSEWIPEGKIVSVATGGRNHTKAIMTIELPKTYNIDDQEIKTYVNISNSLDGIWPIGLTVSPLRVVCTNQFVLNRKSAFISLQEKHTRPGVIKFQQDLRLVNEIYNLMEGQLEIAEKLINNPCTTEKGIDFINKLQTKKIIPAKIMDKAKSLYENPIRKEDEPRNYWSLFNAVTDPLNEELRERHKTTTFNNIEKVGDVFTALANA